MTLVPMQAMDITTDPSSSKTMGTKMAFSSTLGPEVTTVPVIAQVTQVRMAPMATWSLGISMEVAGQTLGIHRVFGGIGYADTRQLSGLGKVTNPDMELDPWLGHFPWL